jgi:amino acid adenylation domain-containing protein/non-ribosomal peptide synthase protein (TIGR01720 family)
MPDTSPPELVGLMAGPHPDLLVGMLGILKSGSGFVPIDPDHPIERVHFILDDCRIRILVTENRHLDKAIEAARRCASLQHIICLDPFQSGDTTPDDGVRIYDCADFAREAPTAPPAHPEPDQLAYVIYTSGSTGTPKGVPITHRNLSPLLCWSRDYFRFGEHTRVLQTLNYCFDFGVFELLTTMLFGGTLHFADKTDFSTLPAYINGNEINTLHATPSFFRNLLSFSDRLESLEVLHLGGEALTGEIMEEIYDKVGEACVVYNGYGPTEATINCSIFEVGSRAVWRQRPLANVPIGKASANNYLYVLNKAGKLVPPGVPGELYVGGDGLSRGYLNRDDLTAASFIRNPFGDGGGARLYKTGDLVRYLPDGRLEFLGRRDHQVKIRGLRIELGEIEAALKQHPAVRDVVVLAVGGMGQMGPNINPISPISPINPRNREDKRLVAWLVPTQNEKPAAGELREFLGQRLPAYMAPAAYVWLDALPLTPNGKLDRRALPDPREMESARTLLAPRTPNEQRLAEIWKQVLGLDEVGVTENFFELGGDSMRIIHLVARARQTGLAISPAAVFQHPTIRAIAALAELDGARASLPAAAPPGRDAHAPSPLTPIQTSFFARQVTDPHHWNWAFLREIPEPLDPALLTESFRRLLDHHDALRMRFVQTADGWRQHTAEPEPAIPLTVTDLSALDAEAQSAAIEAAAAALQGSLDLEHGPLLRIAYFALGQGRADRLLLLFHHLVVDVISTQILMDDFQTVYQQLRRGEAVALPPKTTSYREWAHRLNEHAQSSELAEELSYWSEALSGETAALPLDFPGGDNGEASAAMVSTAFSPDETHALLRGGQDARAPEILLAALARSWARWAGPAPLLVDVEGHGREEILDGVDLSRTVGWFTSFYPVRLDPGAASAPPAESLRLVRAQMRRIPHRGIGYGLLRFLCRNPELQQSVQALPRADLNFNYLGQLDQNAPSPATTPVRMARENKGPERSLRGTRAYPLYVVGSVRGGVLRMHWNYSTNLHRQETIERLAAYFDEELRRLI